MFGCSLNTVAPTSELSSECKPLYLPSHCLSSDPHQQSLIGLHFSSPSEFLSICHYCCQSHPLLCRPQVLLKLFITPKRAPYSQVPTHLSVTTARPSWSPGPRNSYAFLHPSGLVHFHPLYLQFPVLSAPLFLLPASSLKLPLNGWLVMNVGYRDR